MAEDTHYSFERERECVCVCVQVLQKKYKYRTCQNLSVWGYKYIALPRDFPFKKIELKASGQDKNYQTLPDSLQCPAPTLKNLAYSFLPPTRKGKWPTPHPAPIGAIYAPQPTSKYTGRPYLSPNNQQVNRSITRPLLSPWAIKIEWPPTRVGSPWLLGSCPAALAVSPISINSSFFSLHYESGKIFPTIVYGPWQLLQT